MPKDDCTLSDEYLDRSLSRRTLLKVGSGAALGLMWSPAAGASVARQESVLRAKPKMGGTLALSYPSDIPTFDPTMTSSNATIQMVGQPLFQTLVRYNHAMKLEGDAAASWAIPNPTTYIFKLRPNQTFSNGRRLTADDVVWSLNDVVQNHKVYASKLATVKSIQAVKPLTVKIELTSPNAPFLDSLALIVIVPKEAAAMLATHPVGSGPFEFVSWTPNTNTVYRRRPGYWNRPQPYVDQVVIEPVPDASVAANRLVSGQLEVVTNLPAALTPAYAHTSGVNVAQFPSNVQLITHIAVNKYKPLGDVRVRQALAYALDKDAVNKTVFFGAAKPQWSPVPTGLGEYHIEPKGYRYDPEKAKALLKAAGYGSGLDLEVLVIAGYSDMKGLATVWQDGLKKAGANLKITEYDVSTWLKHYYSFDYQLLINIKEVSGDPNDMFDRIFHPMLGPFAGFSSTAYTNPQMLSLILKAAATTNQKKRIAIYKQLQTMAVQQVAPVLVFGVEPQLALESRHVHGLFVNAWSRPFIEHAWIQ